MTDKSGYTTEAILSKIQNDKEWVIAYGSIKLQDAESKYTTTEQECLAALLGL
jgi:hypothetical protein